MSRMTETTTAPDQHGAEGDQTMTTAPTTAKTNAAELIGRNARNILAGETLAHIAQSARLIAALALSELDNRRAAGASPMLTAAEMAAPQASTPA